MTDRAAALTYYAMMSLFPALLLGITLLGTKLQSFFSSIANSL